VIDFKVLGIILCIQIIPFLLIGLPFSTYLFLKHKINFQLIDYIPSVLGGITWYFLDEFDFFSVSQGKSISNGIAEPLIIGFVIGVLFNVNIYLKYKHKKYNFPFLFMFITILISTLVYCFTPHINE